jgi:hypothetical protein
MLIGVQAVRVQKYTLSRLLNGFLGEHKKPGA